MARINGGDRARLIEAVQDKKERLWGESNRYNSQHSKQYVTRPPGGSNPPTREVLQWFMETDDEMEILEKIRNSNADDYDDYKFLLYR